MIMGNTVMGNTVHKCECCDYYAETILNFKGDVWVGSNTVYPLCSLSHRLYYCNRCANFIRLNHIGSHRLKLATLYQICQQQINH